VKDLTKGSIAGHLLQMSLPIVVGMLVQTLYFLVDLLFVARLGDKAIAGVGSAGNVMYIVLALTQMLGVGTVALIAQAVGRKDQPDANLVFNQSLVLSAGCAVLTLLLGYGFADRYMNSLGADAGTRAAGLSYLRWYIPALSLQFALVVMGSALRGTGIVKPTMVVQMLTVVLNIILAPVLIAGWGTGRPLGVAGAAIASLISVAAGTLLLAFYFVRLETYVRFHRDEWRPRFVVWRRMLTIGLPAGAEFLLMFIVSSAVYWIIRDFGAAAQAGFGVGSRIMQAIFLPAMAIAFSVSPIAGQNFGAGHGARVRETLRVALVMSAVLMFALTLLAQIRPRWLIAGFSSDAQVLEFGTTYLRMLSWNFVATGIVFTCSSMFQALGNTVPSLVSTLARVLLFVLPAIWLSRQPGFHIEQVWVLSVVSVAIQAVISLWLVRRELRIKLTGLVPPTAAASSPAAAVHTS
jgi:putative MATE family efflux protein